MLRRDSQRKLGTKGRVALEDEAREAVGARKAGRVAREPTDHWLRWHTGTWPGSYCSALLVLSLAVTA